MQLFGERALVPTPSSSGGFGTPAPAATVRVTSYNVLADCNAGSLTYDGRKDKLLHEIASAMPHIIALQDVEMFDEFWRPRLNKAGFDTVFKQRTSVGSDHREGVLIAWRRDHFQLCRSESLELNELAEHASNSVLKGRAGNADNIATMVLLQPWQSSSAPAGLCVICAQLCEDNTAAYSSVDTTACDPLQLLQAKGLVRAVEAFNSDLNLPVVLCGTFNCKPGTTVYEALCRGQREKESSAPNAPPSAPTVTADSSSAAVVRWQLPEPAPVIAGVQYWAITGYRISWCAGGNRYLGFSQQQLVCESDAYTDALLAAEAADKLHVQLIEAGADVANGESPEADVSSSSAYFHDSAFAGCDADPYEAIGSAVSSGGKQQQRRQRGRDDITFRQTTITGLSSGVVYEFKVAACNAIGTGECSQVSAPLRMPDYRISDTGHRPQQHTAAHSSSKSSNSIANSNSHGSIVSSSSDRKSVKLKDSTAPDLLLDLEGVRSLRQQQRQQQQQAAAAIADATVGQRDQQAKHGHGGGLSSEHSPRYADGTLNLQQSAFRTPSGPAHQLYVYQPDSYSAAGVASSKPSQLALTAAAVTATVTAKVNDDSSAPTADSFALQSRGTALQQSKCCDDAVAATVHHMIDTDITGARLPCFDHSLGLRSVYQLYSSAGEPAFTHYTAHAIDTVDYIFHSGDALIPISVLSLPELDDIDGYNLQKLELAVDTTSNTSKPAEWCDTISQTPAAAAAADSTTNSSNSTSSISTTTTSQYIGEWCPYLHVDDTQWHSSSSVSASSKCLPNKQYPSSHLMLVTDLQYNCDACSTTSPSPKTR